MITTCCVHAIILDRCLVVCCQGPTNQQSNQTAPAANQPVSKGRARRQGLPYGSIRSVAGNKPSCRAFNCVTLSNLHCCTVTVVPELSLPLTTLTHQLFGPPGWPCHTALQQALSPSPLAKELMFQKVENLKFSNC